jgi:L-ascorbate metabolism protein UlaG (beta-lactamase superfamily)
MKRACSQNTITDENLSASSIQPYPTNYLRMKPILFSFIFLFSMVFNGLGQSSLSHDEFQTSKGKLTVYFLGHGTLMFDFGGKIVHVDPWSKLADYSTLPKADLILVTHEHGDHLDSAAIRKIQKQNTQLIENGAIYDILKKGLVMKNGDTKTIDGIGIEAIPAYNTTTGREKFHPKGRDNGFVLTFGNKRVYVAGDTEDIPEMEQLKNIDIAFLPMNQPYTMLPEQVAKAALSFKPKILYPYHYGETDVTKLKGLIPENSGIEVRIRALK